MNRRKEKIKRREGEKTKKQNPDFCPINAKCYFPQILNSYILQKVNTGEYKKVLFVATGALLSTTSSQQGETIPGISHAIVIEHYEEKNPKKLKER